MEGEGEEEAYVGWKNRASSRQHPSSEVENNEGKEAVGSQDLLPSFLFFHAALALGYYKFSVPGLHHSR